jgi:hypothetical protein
MGFNKRKMEDDRRQDAETTIGAAIMAAGALPSVPALPAMSTCGRSTGTATCRPARICPAATGRIKTQREWISPSNLILASPCHGIDCL